MPPEPAGSAKRQVATALDTALLAFFVLAVLAVAWWLLKAVFGTVLFFAKLAVLAVLIAIGIRAWVLVRSRFRRMRGSGRS